MNKHKKAQIATEYLLLTAFVLIAVAIIFAFSFVNYNQNIRVAEANETLSKLASAVDDVYIRGPGNNRYTTVSLPDGMATLPGETQSLRIIHKCVGADPNQGTLSQCGGSYEDIEFSAFQITINLISGSTTILKETRAKIKEDLGGWTTPEWSGSSFPVRISWVSGIIQIDKAG